MRDTIIHEVTGLVVRPGNPEALANVIIKALKNPDLRFRMGREARIRVAEMFDWGIIAQKYAGVYKINLRLQ